MCCLIDVVYGLKNEFKVSMNWSFQIAVVNLVEPKQVDEFVV